MLSALQAHRLSQKICRRFTTDIYGTFFQRRGDVHKWTQKSLCITYNYTPLCRPRRYMLQYKLTLLTGRVKYMHACLSMGCLTLLMRQADALSYPRA